MQTLDARHIELFLSEGYRDGSWEYQIIGSHDIKKHADGASAGIFDIKHLNDSSTSGNPICFMPTCHFILLPASHFMSLGQTSKILCSANCQQGPNKIDHFCIRAWSGCYKILRLLFSLTLQ